MSAGTIIAKLVAVFMLVLANGFFVAAEFPLVGVRVSHIETLVASGHSSAKRLMGLLQNLNAYLSACQLGITLASLALGGMTEAGHVLKPGEVVQHGLVSKSNALRNVA